PAWSRPSWPTCHGACGRGKAPAPPPPPPSRPPAGAAPPGAGAPQAPRDGAAPGLAAPAGWVVPLDELVVGVRDGRLRVWWPAGRVEMEVAAGHMLSPAEAPAVCRVLGGVGRGRRGPL